MQGYEKPRTLHPAVIVAILIAALLAVAVIWGQINKPTPEARAQALVQQAAYEKAFGTAYREKLQVPIMETGLFSGTQFFENFTILVLTANNDWYDLSYPEKKDVTGSLYLLFREARLQAGADSRVPCQVRVQDKWGELLAECNDPQEIKIKR